MPKKTAKEFLPKESLEIDAVLQPGIKADPLKSRFDIIREHIGEVAGEDGLSVDAIYHSNGKKLVLDADDLPSDDDMVDDGAGGLAVDGRPIGLSLDND